LITQSNKCRGPSFHQVHTQLQNILKVCIMNGPGNFLKSFGKRRYKEVSGFPCNFCANSTII
jgi:hypothetical protein